MRFLLLLLTCAVGCSTAPLAGFLDRFYPGGVRARDFDAPAGSGIGVGPPRPIDPLVEAPRLSIPSNPPRPNAPATDDVIPPPTIGRNVGEIGRTAAFRASELKK